MFSFQKEKKMLSWTPSWITVLLKHGLSCWKCKLRIKCLSKSCQGITWISPKPANGVEQEPVCLFLVWHINNLVHRSPKSSFRTGLCLVVNTKQMLKKRGQLWEVINRLYKEYIVSKASVPIRGCKVCRDTEAATLVFLLQVCILVEPRLSKQVFVRSISKKLGKKYLWHCGWLGFLYGRVTTDGSAVRRKALT